MSDSLFEHDKDSVVVSSRSAQEFLSKLSDVRLDQRNTVQVAIVFSRAPIDEILLEFSQVGDTSLSLSAEDRSEVYPVRYHHLRRSFGRKRRLEVSGSFVTVKTDQPNVWLLAMVAPTPFWTEGVAKLLDRLHPHVVRPFFTQREMGSFVRTFEERAVPNVARIVRISGREKLRAPESRRKYEASLRWTDTDIETALHEASENNLLFRNLAIEIVSLKDGHLSGEGPRGTISREGYVSCNGSFRLFYEAVIFPMTGLAQRRLDFFSNRERHARASEQLKPIKIKYDRDIFSAREQVHRLLEVMKRFKHGSCSVLHGNPYIHVSIVDNYDFSAADIWVVNRDDILIVPQIKTSEAALKRIVNHIFENFREGQLGEYTSS
jgi:hypothetical protein